jgi:hypothetical protein
VNRTFIATFVEIAAAIIHRAVLIDNGRCSHRFAGSHGGSGHRHILVA